MLTKGGPELYNLREDPSEQNNLFAAEPDRAAEMDRMMREFTARLVQREGQA
jgi:hypothetical protein